MAVQPLEVLIRLRDELTGKMKQVQQSVQETGKNFSNLESVVKTAGSALVAYSGIRIMGSFINETRQANQMLAQARFVLGTLGKETADKLMPQIIAAGKEMENLGVSDEIASLAMARLTVKMKDTSKALDWLNLLTKVQKLGSWDLETSTRMLMGTVEDSRRALAYLAKTIGLEVNPEYEDMDEILRKLKRAMEGVDFSGLGLQIDEFKERWRDIKEKVGTPFLDAVNLVLEGVNWLMERFPSLGTVIADTLLFITTTFIGFVGGIALSKFLGFFGITLEAAGLWGVAIGAIIGGVILIWAHFGDEIIGVYNKIKESLTEFYTSHKESFDRIKEEITKFISTALSPLKSAWDMLKDSLGELWGALGKLGEAIWKLIQALSPIFIPILEFLAKFIGLILVEAFNLVIAAIVLLISVLTGLIKGLTFVITLVSNVIDWFAKLIAKVWEVISSKEKLKETFLGVWNDIKNGFKPIYDAIIGWLGNIVDWSEKAISKVGEAAKWVGEKVGIVKGSKQTGGYIPETGLYMLHQGEYVLPRGRLAYAGAGISGINIVITGNTFMSDENTAVKIGDMIIKVLKRNIKI